MVLAFILAFSAVIVLIEDLDRPINGFLEVSHGQWLIFRER